MAQFLHIGTIGRAHGLRGQVKVVLDNAESEALMHIRCFWTGAPGAQSPAGELKKWQVREARGLTNGHYLVTLDGVPDRTAAEALLLQEVYADRDHLPELSDDEVYQADLVGCRVVQAGGVAVGTVRAIDKMNGNFLLVVERQGRDDALIPLVPQMITNVDLGAGTVEIDPPEGLLDLDLRGD
jgi:16S rRNA processing protein RimM